MIIIDLNEEQIEEIETRLSSYDEKYITYKMNGCIQRRELIDESEI